MSNSEKNYNLNLLPFGPFTFIWLVLFMTGHCGNCGGDTDYIEMLLSEDHEEKQRE